MGQVIVRNLDDQVIEAHKRRAASKGISLEQELRDVLTMTSRVSRAERLARADRIAAKTRNPDHPLAEDLIREDRDAR